LTHERLVDLMESISARLAKTALAFGLSAACVLGSAPPAAVGTANPHRALTVRAANRRSDGNAFHVYFRGVERRTHRLSVRVYARNRSGHLVRRLFLTISIRRPAHWTAWPASCRPHRRTLRCRLGQLGRNHAEDVHLRARRQAVDAAQVVARAGYTETRPNSNTARLRWWP
jgi:hypothetical protein